MKWRCLSFEMKILLVNANLRGQILYLCVHVSSCFLIKKKKEKNIENFKRNSCCCFLSSVQSNILFLCVIYFGNIKTKRYFRIFFNLNNAKKVSFKRMKCGTSYRIVKEVQQLNLTLNRIFILFFIIFQQQQQQPMCIFENQVFFSLGRVDRIYQFTQKNHEK